MIHPARYLRRHWRRIAGWYLAGMLVALAVAWGFAFLGSPGGWSLTSAESSVGHGRWHVDRWSSSGIVVVVSSFDALTNRNWGTEQLLGPPNTPGSGDLTTAWASATPDGQMEWLRLEYANAVIPRAVEVVETYNPGALIRVSVFNGAGQEVTVWQGIDPTPAGAGRGVSRIPISVDFPVRSVKVYLDSALVPGWNEIDAVGLVDDQGTTQWARAAQASSTYMQGSNGGSPDALIPSWSSLAPVPEDSAADELPSYHKVSVGYGWPLPACHAEQHEPVKNPGLSLPVYRGTFVPFGGTSTPPPGPFPLPYRPVWWGLALDGAVWGSVLCIIHLLLTWPRRVFRELMRIRRGQCLRCGYQLRYDFVHGCPECGWQREHSASPPQ